jgi:hypothetical protein
MGDAPHHDTRQGPIAAVTPSNREQRMTFDQDLIAKGMREPRIGLVQQGHVHLGLIAQHEAALVKSGWTAEEAVALRDGVASLDGMRAEQLDARADAKQSTVAQEQALGDAKAFIRRVRNAAPLAVADGAKAGVVGSIEEFHSGRSIGRRVSSVVDYLGRLAGPVSKYDAQLARYLGSDEAPSAALARVKAALQDADARQELKVAALPADTDALYETKGRVLTLIERVNRIAKLAFDGDARTIGLFNKDLVLRARGRRSEAAPPSPSTPA